MEFKIKMEYRLLGQTSLKVSVLSFGNFLFSYSEEQEKIHSDIINLVFDLYGNGVAEEQFGRIINKHGFPRESLM